MSALTPPAYETVAPPLPLLSGEERSVSGYQPWHLSLVREILDREMTPRDAILGVVCENVTVEDHRRCHHIMNIRRWKRGLIPLAIFLLVLSALRGATSLDFSIAFLQTLLVLSSVATAIGLLIYLYQRSYTELFVRAYVMRHAEGAMVLLANPEGIYDLTRFLQFLIPWNSLQNVEAVGSDVFLYYTNGGKTDNAYLPRRAFASEADARLFAEALRQLEKAKGDPSTLSTEARTTFPPPYQESR